MSLRWNIQEQLANEHYAELLHEAQNERRAREARADTVGVSPLSRVFSWLEGQASKSKSPASQKLSYLDNPDPFRNCVTC